MLTRRRWWIIIGVGEVMDLGEIEAAAKSSTMIKCTLVLCRLELACITGDYNLAGDILTDAPDLLAARPGHFSGCRYTVYEFLASSKKACRQISKAD